MSQASNLPAVVDSTEGATEGPQSSGLGSVLSIVPILAILVLWEFVARAHLFPPVLFPSFLTVSEQILKLALHRQLLDDIITTSLRAGGGLTLATAAGVIIGLMMARVSLFRWFFEPLIALGFPMPKITLVPVFILWFGIGHESKVLLVAFTCFFPIALSTMTGARLVDRKLIWSAQAMGTTEQRLFWRIILPATLPFILSGIRIALPVALIVAFVAEMVGGGGGLGFTLVYGYRYLETPTVFAVLLTILVLGFFLDRLLAYIRLRLLVWEDAEKGVHR